MKSLLLLLFVVIHCISFSQIDDKLKNKEFDFEVSTQEGIDQLLTNIFSFVGEDFDSLDVQLLVSGELIATLMIQKSSNEHTLTYGDLYEKMLEMKQRPEFSEYKANSIIILDFLEKPADFKNWEEDQKLLSKLEDDRHTILTIGSIIKEKNDPSLTYQDILEEFYEEQNAREEKERQEILHEIYQKFIDIELFDEEKLLIQSKQENKPILLYFTGYNCVNARKMEEGVLFRPAVADVIMENFILVPLYTDEKTELPKKLQKKVKYKDNKKFQKTIGERNSFYQYNRFETSGQPYFVILNSENEIIATADYNYRTVEKFLSFLEISLEKK